MNSNQCTGLGQRIRNMKQKCLDSMETLARQAGEKLKSNGIAVFMARSAHQAGDYISSLTGGQSPVILSGTGVDRELGLYRLLFSGGCAPVDAGLANRALRELGLPPRHPLEPLSGYDQRDIILKLERHYGEKWISFEKWREEHYALLAGAAAGVTGCTALAAREGVVMIAEHMENAHLASTLPPVHVVVAGYDKVVPSIEEALLVARGVSFYGAGKAVARNLFFISGPSATADIQGLIVKGMHGPREVHVILLDNGRTRAGGEDRDLLMCIECGLCLESCPVFLEQGPAYPENASGAGIAGQETGDRRQEGESRMGFSSSGGAAGGMGNYPENREAPFGSCWAMARGGREGDCRHCGNCATSCPLGIPNPQSPIPNP